MTCIANCSGATLLSRHWTRSLRPQQPSKSTARMYAHRIPPTTHPPMTNFTLSPSKYRQGQEARRVVIDPIPPIATTLSAGMPPSAPSPDKLPLVRALTNDQYSGCLGKTAYQIRLPTNA
ncbi:hypothetical protein CF326_g10094 [Tilletia indica]|nr:hypothetical protein CF326_g10094 [Tilletia indica]